MKVFLLIFVVTGLYSQSKPTNPQWQSTNTFNKGMVRFFSVGSDPTTVIDYASSHNLTCSNAALTLASGGVGNELSSTSNTSCLGSDVGMPFGNSTWSVAVMFQSSVVLANATSQNILYWGTLVLNQVAVIAQYTTPQYCSVSDTFAVTLLGSLICGTSTINDGKWHSGVVTYDQTGISIYVDGSLQSRSAYSGINITLSGVITVAGWTGVFGPIAVLNRVLSASEVKSFTLDPYQSIRPVPTIANPIGMMHALMICEDKLGNLSLCPASTLQLQNVAPLGATQGPQGIQGLQGVQGIAGIPGSGNLTLQGGIAVTALNPPLTDVINPDPVTGTYTLGSNSVIGTIVSVTDTVTHLGVVPGEYTANGNVVTLVTPTGHPLYFVWWGQ